MRFPSGQREQTVNLPAQLSKVQILPSPPLIQTTLPKNYGMCGFFFKYSIKYIYEKFYKIKFRRTKWQKKNLTEANPM